MQARRRLDDEAADAAARAAGGDREQLLGQIRRRLQPQRGGDVHSEHAAMTPARKTALVAGILYLITFASSIPAKFSFIDPVLANPDFMSRAGIANPLLWGSFLDLVNALACIGTSVALFSLVKRQHEGFALGFVATRLFEAAVIVIGVISLLSVVTLHQNAGAAGADAAVLATTGNALAAAYEWAFLIGPVLMAALNALLLGTLMYRSRLVPPAIPVMGLIGAPLSIVSFAALFFGLHEIAAPTHFIAVVPIGLWELSLGIYMAVKGFKPSPITAQG